MRMLATAIGAIACITLGGAPSASAADARRDRFGVLPDGHEVSAVTLSNANGLSATVLAYGATLQSVMVPDRTGHTADVALGYGDIKDYLAKPQYFGSTVGRVANRIAAGHFVLDGKTYRVPVNNGLNSLHGGTFGLDKVLWEITSVSSGPTASVVLRHVSRDGDQGYPGTLTVEATYALDEANALSIEYRATTDRTTVANITNHAYWNLAGEGSDLGAMGHLLTIPAQTFTPVDAGLIPTGEFRRVEGTVFDFREARPVGLRVRDARDPQIGFGRGYDHNWVVSRTPPAGLQLMALVTEPTSGRGFELWSNQPGLQFYSGNFLDATSAGKSSQTYRMGDAIVLEPQMFPDTVNRPAFGSVRLEPGQTYRNIMIYKFSNGR